jgi:hypothetical protein
VLAWAPMAELRLIMVKDKIMRTARSPMLVDAAAPQASPIMSDPRFGSRNSALETVLKDLRVSSISTGKKVWRTKGVCFEAEASACLDGLRVFHIRTLRLIFSPSLNSLFTR